MKKFFICLILSIVSLSATQTDQSQKDAKKIYKTCANCHGINGDSPALGKSAVINLMNEEQISRALNGYLDGSYGGELKIVMKIEAQKLTKEEIQSVAKYIQTLRK